MSSLVMVCSAAGVCCYHADGGAASDRCPGFCDRPGCDQLAEDGGRWCQVDDVVEALKQAHARGQLLAVVHRFGEWIEAAGKGLPGEAAKTRAEPPF